ncbi:MAG TPA: hypothetical protein VF777_05075 [Phycisphaerales bacterium]
MSEAGAIIANLQRERRRAGVAAGSLVVVALGWLGWSAWGAWRVSRVGGVPVAASASPRDQITHGSPSKQRTDGYTVPIAALDEQAFRARLWVAPPRAAAAEVSPPPAPPPPFKLQLVGVRHSEVGAAALVYDPERVRLTAVKPGAAVGRYTLDTLDPVSGHAVFTDTQHPGKPRHTLRLNTLAAPRTPLKIVATPPGGGGVP